LPERLCIHDARAAPNGFAYTRRQNGEVVISHDRGVATVLRGQQAERFVERVGEADPQ
jgi:hypothetical protein